MSGRPNPRSPRAALLQSLVEEIAGNPQERVPMPAGAAAAGVDVRGAAAVVAAWWSSCPRRVAVGDTCLSYR